MRGRERGPCWGPMSRPQRTVGTNTVAMWPRGGHFIALEHPDCFVGTAAQEAAPRSPLVFPSSEQLEKQVPKLRGGANRPARLQEKGAGSCLLSWGRMTGAPFHSGVAAAHWCGPQAEGQTASARGPPPAAQFSHLAAWLGFRTRVTQVPLERHFLVTLRVLKALHHDDTAGGYSQAREFRV